MMMRGFIKKATLIVFASIIALPINIHAKTIKEFEAEVAKYTAELQAKQDKLAKNDAEIAEIKKKISSIEGQIKQLENEKEELQKEIDDSNKEIEKKSEESKKIMEYYQIANGDNAYLEYAFGAQTITDMIYRMSIVEQLTEYNDKIMKELKELIKKNNARKEELAKKNIELKELEKSLEEQKERIYADSASIRETMPTVEEQIKAAKANVSYYKGLGCGANEDIQACQYRIQQKNGSQSVPSANGFLRPIEYGYIVRGYDWNNSKGYGSHMGYDISSSNKSISVYPIATGTVFKIYYDNCSTGNTCSFVCNGRAKVVKIRHNINGRYIYSTYAHLSSFGNISEGMVVTQYTEIGKMGTSGCSTGPHLHLEVTSCDWNTPGGGCTWAQYQRSTINPTTYVSFPSSWNNR